MQPLDKHRQEDFVQHLFTTIAHRYDFLNAAFTARRDAYWRRTAADAAGLQPGQKVLDVCCGTGKLAIELAQRLGPQGQVIGVDFCPEMLVKARENIRLTPYDANIELLEGNALALPFADNTFAAAAIGFGLRNVADIGQTLREMQRVVKPGGMVVAVELSKPTAPILKQLYFLYFQKLLPMLGNLGFGRDNPYYNLPASLQTLPPPETIRDFFLAAGLQQVEFHPLTGGIAALHQGRKQ